MKLKRLLLMPLSLTMTMVLSSCAGLLASCGPTPVTGRLLIPTLQEFAAFTIPIFRRGRTAASFGMSSGKFVLKLEREITKSGIKVGASVPLGTFQEIATAMYMAANNGQLPRDAFDDSAGMFIIVRHNGERTIFMAEHKVVCIANVAEVQLIWLSPDSRSLTISATQEVTDVMFGTDDEGCNEINAEIDRRKNLAKAEQDNAIKAAVAAALSAQESPPSPSPTVPPSVMPVTRSPELDWQQCARAEYPKEALRNENEGTVGLVFLVNTGGQVIDSEIERSSGYRDLDIAALRAVRQCNFKPGLSDGQPVEAWVKLNYVWELNQ
jgi:TonB family protein